MLCISEWIGGDAAEHSWRSSCPLISSLVGFGIIWHHFYSASSHHPVTPPPTIVLTLVVVLVLGNRGSADPYPSPHPQPPLPHLQLPLILRLHPLLVLLGQTTLCLNPPILLLLIHLSDLDGGQHDLAQ